MMNSITPHLILCSVFLSANGFAETTLQQVPVNNNVDQNALSEVFINNIALTRHQLDRQRGGFVSPNGFKISIGFEKVVVINGKLEAKSQFYIPALNLANQSNYEINELAAVMDALKDRLEDQEINGNHSKNELAVVSDNIDGVANTLNDQLANASNQQDALTLTTGQRSGNGQYTDSLLSMLKGSQSLIDNAATNTYLPDNLTTVVMNSQDSSLIQNFQLLNIKIDNLGQYRSRSVNALMLPQIIHSLR